MSPSSFKASIACLMERNCISISLSSYIRSSSMNVIAILFSTPLFSNFICHECCQTSIHQDDKHKKEYYIEFHFRRKSFLYSCIHNIHRFLFPLFILDTLLFQVLIEFPSHLVCSGFSLFMLSYYLPHLFLFLS